jgi:hypothetical protein
MRFLRQYKPANSYAILSLLEPQILAHLFMVSHIHKVSGCGTFFSWAESVDLQWICKVHLCHKKVTKVLYKYPLSTKPMCLSMCHSLLSVCLSVCLRITEWIFLQFDTGNSHKKFSSHFSVALDHIILPYNLHEEWLIFPMTSWVFLSLYSPESKHLNKTEGMHQHSYTMHLFLNI